MKSFLRIFTLALSLALMLGAGHVQAKRMSGGQSAGKQSNNVSQQAAPAQSAPAAAKPAPAAAPAAAPAPRRPWGAMLGGLAAGLGLAWLASSLGLGAEFGEFLMFALLALVIMVGIGWFMRRRAAAQQPAYALQGAHAGSADTLQPGYRPENVGNDASARPWERNQAVFETSGYNARPQSSQGIVIGSGLATPPSTWSIPEGFDTERFLAAAKVNFVDMQAAWDKADLATLRAMMTDDMLEEMRQQLADRESHTGGALNHTDVVMIDAKLLGIEDLGNDYMASVEFSGMIREEPSAGPSPFREVWNLVKPKYGNAGWLVAGVQALQ